jgi:hypothetical protein
VKDPNDLDALTAYAACIESFLIEMERIASRVSVLEPRTDLPALKVSFDVPRAALNGHLTECYRRIGRLVCQRKGTQ